MERPFILGVSGGSGSGKTYFARELCEKLGTENCVTIYQDSFYRDQSSLFDQDGGAVNFDHPDSIEFDLLCEKINELKKGHVTNIPIYDFATHKRADKFQVIKPHKIILVDGILILNDPKVRECFDESVFFDMEESLRFERRLQRDVKERGRTEAGVRDQFFKQVAPMHDKFVEPSKKYAKWTIHEPSQYSKLLNDVYSYIIDVVKLES